MDQMQLIREQLPTDPSEIESHLLSHFASELGGREEGSVGGELESDGDDIDVELQDKYEKRSRKVVSGKKENKCEKSRARQRKPHEVSD